MGIEDTIKALQMEQKNAHFLVVDGFSKFLQEGVEVCPSMIFYVSGLKWKLHIYPSGEKCAKDYLSFYLKLKDTKSLGSNWEVTCSFELSVLSQTRPNKKESYEWDDVCYDEDGTNYGKECFMTHKQLNEVKKGYIVNDKVVFCAEITDVKPNFYMTVFPRTMKRAERLKLIDIPRENSKFTWKITQFSSFTDGRQDSYEFTVGPRRWRLVMYPNGDGDGEGNSLSVFLKACDYVTDGPKTKTLTIYKLRVLDQLYRNHIENFHVCWISYDPVGVKSIWGNQEMVPLKELHRPSRGLLVNDQIYIGVEFFIISTYEYL